MWHKNWPKEATAAVKTTKITENCQFGRLCECAKNDNDTRQMDNWLCMKAAVAAVVTRRGVDLTTVWHHSYKSY